MEPLRAQLLHRLSLPCQPDCVSWCPVPGYERLLLVSTYRMNESKDLASVLGKKRDGFLFLLELVENADNPESASLRILSQIPIGGVFESLFLLERNPPCAVSALSDGRLVMVSIPPDSEEKKSMMSLVDFVQCSEDMLTCIDVVEEPNRLQLVAGSSDGKVHLIEARNGTGLQTVSSWDAHKLPFGSYAQPAEVWAVAYGKSQSNVSNLIFSGGDDCKLKAWDIRHSPSGHGSLSSSYVHEGGVTALLTDIQRPDKLLSGSYDQRVRLFDTRNVKMPVWERDVGGGVWNLRWNLLNERLLGASCMYGGWAILACENDGATVVVAEDDGSKLLYGFDWCHSRRCSAPNLSYFATCTFYDREVQLLRTN